MNVKIPSFSGSDVDVVKPDLETIQISFIVPVYNVENYIRACVQSILELEHISFEIILVDDGSVDKSMEKVADLIAENPMIKTVKQENKGQAAARNSGLDLAKGNYIFFVDSDDQIDASAVQQVFSEVQGNEDIVIGDFYQWDGNTSFLNKSSLVDHPLRTTGKRVLQQFFFRNLYSVVWRNLYKRSFLRKHHFSFLEGVYFEDAEWVPRSLALAKEVLYVNQAFYLYRNEREGSTMNSPFSVRKYHDLFKVSQAIESFASRLGDKTAARVMSQSASNLLLTALKHAESANLPVDLQPMLAFYKNLKLPLCNNKVMQYILFFSERLFFMILKRRSL